jgi:MATE family multidrug resistance protein
MAGYISVDVTAVQIILLNLSTLLYMIQLGIQQGAATVVGNAIGENNIKKGKKYAKLTVLISIGISFICILVMMINRNTIPTLFTDDQTLISLTSYAMKFMVISFTFDALQGVLAGVIKGLGL